MYDKNFKKASSDLMSYCKEHLGYETDPNVQFVTDENNSKSMFGRTAHYQPDNQAVTVYISNRHPKDALRSLAHELVHHAQNLRGDLQNVQTPEGYAQNDPHMRNMEEEAYLKGNMLFRDWEDSHKTQTNSPISIGEQKMDQLKDLIKQKVATILKEAISDGAGAPMSVPVGERHKAKQAFRRGFEDAEKGIRLPRNMADLDNPHYREGAKEGRKEFMLHHSPHDDEIEEAIGPRGGSEISIDPEQGLKIAEIDKHIQQKLAGMGNLSQLMAQRDAMAGEDMYSAFNSALSEILDLQLEEQEETEAQEEAEVQEEVEAQEEAEVSEEVETIEEEPKTINPLSEVKKNQNSLKSLTNIKLQRLNEALMSKLIK